MSGPNAGEITIIVMTAASGINGQFSGLFWFVITPVHEGINGDNIPHLSLNYQSGTFETIIIDKLKEGESYTFNATATNVYGSSQAAISVSILAGDILCTIIIIFEPTTYLKETLIFMNSNYFVEEKFENRHFLGLKIIFLLCKVAWAICYF